MDRLPPHSRAAPPIHPGEILLEEWMKPAGWTVAEFAGRMGVKPGELRLILEQRAPVKPDPLLNLPGG